MKFKAAFLSALKRVGRISQPLPATRFDNPVAEVVSSPEPLAGPWLGAMRNEGTILGDLIEPVADPDYWEASRARTTVRSYSSPDH